MSRPRSAAQGRLRRGSSAAAIEAGGTAAASRVGRVAISFPGRRGRTPPLRRAVRRPAALVLQPGSAAERISVAVAGPSCSRPRSIELQPDVGLGRVGHRRARRLPSAHRAVRTGPARSVLQQDAGLSSRPPPSPWLLAPSHWYSPVTHRRNSLRKPSGYPSPARCAGQPPDRDFLRSNQGRGILAQVKPPAAGGWLVTRRFRARPIAGCARCTNRRPAPRARMTQRLLSTIEALCHVGWRAAAVSPSVLWWRCRAA